MGKDKGPSNDDSFRNWCIRWGDYEWGIIAVSNSMCIDGGPVTLYRIRRIRLGDLVTVDLQISAMTGTGPTTAGWKQVKGICVRVYTGEFHILDDNGWCVIVSTLHRLQGTSLVKAVSRLSKEEMLTHTSSTIRALGKKTYG